MSTLLFAGVVAAVALGAVSAHVVHGRLRTAREERRRLTWHASELLREVLELRRAVRDLLDSQDKDRALLLELAKTVQRARRYVAIRAVEMAALRAAAGPLDQAVVDRELRAHGLDPVEVYHQPEPWSAT